MRILLTNNDISLRTGSELYLYEVARELQARGHEPACFSLKIGPLAKQLIEMGIPVSDDLRALPGPPDVIHGQHFIETTLAAMTYRTVPVISFCHGPEAWQESACQLPNVVRWVAVDHACRSRLIADEKIDPEKITLLLNHFDEQKFPQRKTLPEKPRKALIVSNYLEPQHPAVAAISAACASRDIELEMVGLHFGGIIEDLAKYLAEFDLVFAKARTAIEAMAVGCAVVQVDYFGAGRLVKTDIFDELRLLNFGYRSMTFPISEEHLGHEIDLYDARDAGCVSQRIRQEATLEKTIAELLSIYAGAIAQTASLQEYDPALLAADFWRFHLQLSKLPMTAIYKSRGHPLRLPSYPIAPGGLMESWENILDPHNHETRKIEMAHRDLNIELITDLKRIIQDLEVRLDLSRDKLAKCKTTRLRLAQYKKNTEGQIAHLRAKLLTLHEKNTKLKARRLPPPRRRSLLERMKHFFTSN